MKLGVAIALSTLSLAASAQMVDLEVQMKNSRGDVRLTSLSSADLQDVNLSLDGEVCRVAFDRKKASSGNIVTDIFNGIGEVIADAVDQIIFNEGVTATTFKISIESNGNVATSDGIAFKQVMEDLYSEFELKLNSTTCVVKALAPVGK